VRMIRQKITRGEARLTDLDYAATHINALRHLGTRKREIE